MSSSVVQCSKNSSKLLLECSSGAFTFPVRAGRVPERWAEPAGDGKSQWGGHAPLNSAGPRGQLLAGQGPCSPVCHSRHCSPLLCINLLYSCALLVLLLQN